MVDDNSCQLMGLGVTRLLDHVLKGDAINPLIYDAIIPKALLVHLSPFLAEFFMKQRDDSRFLGHLSMLDWLTKICDVIIPKMGDVINPIIGFLTTFCKSSLL